MTDDSVFKRFFLEQQHRIIGCGVWGLGSGVCEQTLRFEVGWILTRIFQILNFEYCMQCSGVPCSGFLESALSSWHIRTVEHYSRKEERYFSACRICDKTEVYVLQFTIGGSISSRRWKKCLSLYFWIQYGITSYFLCRKRANRLNQITSDDWFSILKILLC